MYQLSDAPCRMILIRDLNTMGHAGAFHDGKIAIDVDRDGLL
jgi:hypothetical protein